MNVMYSVQTISRVPMVLASQYECTVKFNIYQENIDDLIILLNFMFLNPIRSTGIFQPTYSFLIVPLLNTKFMNSISRHRLLRKLGYSSWISIQSLGLDGGYTNPRH